MHTHRSKALIATKGVSGNRMMMVTGFGDALDHATIYSITGYVAQV